MAKEEKAMKLQPRRESDILRSVLELLKARGIFCERMNTGTVASEHKGKRRFVRYGTPGRADVLAIQQVAFQPRWCGPAYSVHRIIWIECKRDSGRQSAAQREFQALVEADGMTYLVVHSATELEQWLEGK